MTRRDRPAESGPRDWDPDPLFRPATGRRIIVVVTTLFWGSVMALAGMPPLASFGSAAVVSWGVFSQVLPDPPAAAGPRPLPCRGPHRRRPR